MASNITMPMPSSLGYTEEKMNNNSYRFPVLKNNRFSSFGSSTSFADSLSSLHAELDGLEYVTDNSQSIINSLNSSNTSSSKSGAFKFEKIDKSHWKDSSKAYKCSGCQLNFKFGISKYHCRRCGEVFCQTCCQYKRRLSPDCLPDPQGILYRVCLECADRNSQSLGVVRNLTMEFVEQRKNRRLIVPNEIARLVHGFQHNVDPSSRFKTVMSGSLSFVKVPEWQKSSSWMESSEVDWCLSCRAKFLFYKVKHHCRICGAVFCDLCCKQNLILYYDNENAAKASLIGVVGCPENEPDICIYVSICKECQEDVEEYQVQRYHLSTSGEVTQSLENLTNVSFCLEKIKGIEQKLTAVLQRYEAQLDIYIFQDGGDEITTGEKTVNVFAKLQSDTSDIFNEYLMSIQNLKKFELNTKTELKIMKNIISLKRQEYSRHFFKFKALRENLETSLPTKALEELQDITNTLAINSTFVRTRQLGMEVLHLATKYKLDSTLPTLFREVDDCCHDELKDFILKKSGDWEEHISILNIMLREQIASKKMILLDQKLINTEGSSYVNDLMIQRCSSILYQALRLLQTKSSERQFSKTKSKLQDLLNNVSKLRLNNKTHYRTFSIISQ